MGADEGNLLVIDVDVILEKCPITIPLRYNLQVAIMVFIIHTYMVAFLVLRVLYVVALVYFAFVSWFFPPESLPGDDVLCRLLPRPLPSVCFLPCLFVLFIYFFPIVFVPDLFWCNFLYLVTTAGFVADQLIM